MSSTQNSVHNSRAFGSPTFHNKPTEFYPQVEHCSYTYTQETEIKDESGLILIPSPIQLASRASRFTLLSEVDAHYETLKVKREIEAAKVESNRASALAKWEADFMSTLPRYSRQMLENIEGPKAYANKIARDIRQAALAKVAAEHKAAWGKPKTSLNKFPHRRNGGGKGKKAPIEADKVRRVDRDGLPVGWSVASIMTDRVCAKRALKAILDAENANTEKVVVVETQVDGLPAGWQKRINESGTFYISPAGGVQKYRPGTEPPKPKVKEVVVFDESVLTSEQLAERQDMIAMATKLAKLVINKPAIVSSTIVSKEIRVVAKVVASKPVITMGAQEWGDAREGEVRSQVRICGKPCNAIVENRTCDHGHSCRFAHKTEEIIWDRVECHHGKLCKRFRYGKCPHMHTGREAKETYLRRIGFTRVHRPAQQPTRVVPSAKPIVELHPTKSAWAKPIVQPTKPIIVIRPVIELHPTKSPWADVKPVTQVRKSGWDVLPDGSQGKKSATQVRKSGWDVLPNGSQGKKPVALARKSGWDVLPDGSQGKKPVALARKSGWDVKPVESESESEDEYDLTMIIGKSALAKVTKPAKPSTSKPAPRNSKRR